MLALLTQRFGPRWPSSGVIKSVFCSLRYKWEHQSNIEIRFKVKVIVIGRGQRLKVKGHSSNVLGFYNKYEI